MSVLRDIWDEYLYVYSAPQEKQEEEEEEVAEEAEKEVEEEEEEEEECKQTHLIDHEWLIGKGKSILCQHVCQGAIDRLNSAP